ncbi:DUF1501 domain-containing protein [Nocardioides albidus]|uniref:DUF1501 domain-containing protein n=1 Tax=Nocardioides albidus TaxID=1517589 RepID=A0A5C4WI81_9ACTN|nr:DUF1501 domain-containing protein [Nocardioides albidus]TNM48140.1 DUF1501 domain-containing protein [Nocardioides albidus]
MTDPCCSDYRHAVTSRRALLRGAGALGAGVATATYGSAFTQTAFAATGTAPRTLVVLSMRGAADGLSLVVPHGDPVYAAARPTIRVPAERLLAADAMFGLHPALAPLVPLWTGGAMAAVHATGLPVANRSHFAAMEAVEDADPGTQERIGWLNRVLGAGSIGSPLRAIQQGSGVLSTQLAGRHPAMTVSRPEDIRLPGTSTPTQAAARQRALRTMWDGAGGPLATAVTDTLEVVDRFAPVLATPPDPANGAGYPDTDLGQALAATARVIRADVGVEVVTVDHGSWDHHVRIGTPDSGSLRSMAQDLAGSVAGFFADLGALADRVTLVTISEFGRRVKENANQGLDHGHGNVMFVIGAGVRGGRYVGQWPGLLNTVDADLPVTTDYRHVLSEVVQSVFGVSPATAFPGLVAQRLDVMTL